VLHPTSPIKTWTQLDRVLHQEENLAWADGVFLLYRDSFARMEAQSGVPAHLALAIMMTESLGGRELGTYPVIETLYNRYLFGTAKMQREAVKQLRSFLRTKPWNACDCGGIYGLRGSSAGAFGYPQFIPRSYEFHGADGDGDGIVNLFSVPDAVASIASHLQENGWRRNQFRALRTYNNSTRYIEIVRGLAADLASMPIAVPVQASAPTNLP
jgi:membrane-bound lytic murein transglycosylase B